MIPWKTFKGRRKLNLASLVKDEKLTTYDKLVEYLRLLHVAPPSLEEYNSAAENATPKSSPSKKSTTTRKPAVTKKAVTSKPKEEEDPSEVWESGLDASYSEKKSTKAPAKRKPATKRATRSTRTTKKKS